MIAYYSTRSLSGSRVPFKHALFRGLAPDGGLYVPDALPLIGTDWHQCDDLATLSMAVLPQFMDMSTEALKPLMEEALNFPIAFKALADDIYVLELFHGPTLSFKDFAARTMARLMNFFLQQEKHSTTILVATSGDTGSAVADGFAGMSAINVVLLYPKGKVSDIQERQLIVKRPNVQAFAVTGDFDDCQHMVKQAFVDEALQDRSLSSANSINIGRLLPQMLYYLWAVKTIHAQYDVKGVNICVPSGNLGSFTAGFLASKAGMSVKQWLVAHNNNRFMPDYLQGYRDAFAFSKTIPTLSNAMDVGAPSNFERLHHLFGDDILRTTLQSSTISDSATQTRIQTTYEQANYLVCPHSAIGLEAIARYRSTTNDMTPTISLATAHPAKFPEAFEALGIPAPKEEALEQLRERPTAVTDLPPEPEALREVLLS